MKFLPMEEFKKRQKSIDPSSKALADTYLKKLHGTQEKVENYRTICGILIVAIAYSLMTYKTTHGLLIGFMKF